MKTVSVLALCFIFCSLSHIVQALLSPTKRAVEKAAAIATGVTIAFSTCLLPIPVSATPDDPFTGKYADPKHPNCKREIVVNKGSSLAKLTGTDGSPGCPTDGSGKLWTLSGTVSGSTILVDFSPKGGPANLKGVYDTSSSPEGVQWPDGNKWSKIVQ
ncbi:hypothetical protein ACA910_015567 [Epithemia clementina (nom. ined.)]